MEETASRWRKSTSRVQVSESFPRVLFLGELCPWGSNIGTSLLIPARGASYCHPYDAGGCIRWLDQRYMGARSHG